MARSTFLSKLPFRSWINGLAREKRRQNPRKQRSRSPPLWVEQLESRLTPATVSQAGTILTVNLDTANEAISFSSTGGTYTLTTSNPTLIGANTAKSVSLCSHADHHWMGCRSRKKVPDGPSSGSVASHTVVSTVVRTSLICPA